MNSDLKDNNLNNNNNDAINMFNVYMFNVHMFNVHMFNVYTIFNSSEIIISGMIMYRHILLRLKIKSVDSVKFCTKLQSELYELNLLTLVRFS